MEEKKVIKISLSTFLLVFTLIIILIMTYFLFKLYNEKQEQGKKIDTLNSQVSSLTSEKQNSQGKVDTISNIINNNPIEDSNNDIDILKPSERISKLFKNYLDAEEYIGALNPVDKFYENEILIGDAVWSGLVAEYKASSTHSKDTADYSAQNLGDFFIDNCWCEGAIGNGIGETIEINAFGSGDPANYYAQEFKHRNRETIEDVEEYLLSDEYNDLVKSANENGNNIPIITKNNISNYSSEITKIAIINGYAKTDELWKNNSRIKKLKLTIDNKIEYILELDDSKDLQLFDINYKNDSILNKINLKFEILKVYPGEKYEDTCLTSLYLSGGTDISWFWY